MNKFEKCITCNELQHDYKNEEVPNCRPPKEVLTFGAITIDRQYREALYIHNPCYDVEEIIGSYQGKNEFFPSQVDWLETQNYDEEE